MMVRFIAILNFDKMVKTKKKKHSWHYIDLSDLTILFEFVKMAGNRKFSWLVKRYILQITRNQL